jgi:hypothetical protein
MRNEPQRQSGLRYGIEQNKHRHSKKDLNAEFAETQITTEVTEYTEKILIKPNNATTGIVLRLVSRQEILSNNDESDFWPIIVSIPNSFSVFSVTSVVEKSFKTQCQMSRALFLIPSILFILSKNSSAVLCVSATSAMNPLVNLVKTPYLHCKVFTFHYPFADFPKNPHFGILP